MTQAVEELLSQAQHDLWKAVEETEFLLSEKSLLARVQAIHQRREAQHVEIIDYSSAFHDDFRRLNYEWIETYFTLEDSDYRALNDPGASILKFGGHIFMARYRGAIVGTCALIKVDDATYELAKMAVTEAARGRGIGWSLGQAAIAKARELGATSLYLESNTALTPAIKLYQKMGFHKIIGQPSAYKRCNIQMELAIAQLA